MSRRGILVTLAGVLALVPRFGRTPMAHRLLVPFVILFLVWQKREQVAAIPRRFCPIGPPLLVTGIVVNAIGAHSHFVLLQPLGIALIAIGYGFWFYGIGIMRELAFPVSCLAFLIPWPDVLASTLTPPLRWAAVHGACFLAHTVGIPAHPDGYDILLPEITLHVEAACSGMQVLMALTAVCALFAYYTRAPIAHRWMLFLIGIPTALVLNIVRVALIIVCGRLVGWDIATGFVHEYSAPLLFVMIVGALQALKCALERLPIAEPCSHSGLS